MAKKKKLEIEAGEESQRDKMEVVNQTTNDNPKKKKKRKKDKESQEDESKNTLPTVSIAVSGSIIDNTQSFELATRLAGQIARAATIFRVDEVVIFDNNSTSMEESSAAITNTTDENESGAAFLVRILQYLETPQYLRRALFPMHNSLRYVGLLPPLDAPHHLRKHEWCLYREGVTLKEKPPKSVGTVVDVGLSKNVVIEQVLEPGQRVTVVMGTDRTLSSDVLHQVVSSSTPRKQGMYWGYKVRYASNLSDVTANCTYEGGYDYVIGTSEHGQTVKSSDFALPKFRHLLIAFGGLAGLEESIEVDKNLKEKLICNSRSGCCSYLPESYIDWRRMGKKPFFFIGIRDVSADGGAKLAIALMVAAGGEGSKFCVQYIFKYVPSPRKPNDQNRGSDLHIPSISPRTDQPSNRNGMTVFTSSGDPLFG